MLRKSSIALLICWCYHTPLSAQVTLDGSLGKSGALPGPNYQIGADLGQQHGGNLFHSFRDFNLQSHESATFSGPNNVQNIISRVTGGNPSSIDGTLRSTIPNADLYFLNPYGIMFGPNAKLDVQGGFHASTADYLRLQDGGRFEARYPNNSLLTVAPVAAFGFLTDTPAPIKTQDSQLAVPKGKTFSLIGGGLEFQSETPLTYENGKIISSSKLFADSGRLNLASVASPGEVILTPVGFDLTSSTKGGHLTATNTHLNVSGEERSGRVWIRGGQFQMTNSVIENRTVTQPGGETDIQVDNLTLAGGAWIGNNTTGTGSGGPIHLQVTDELVLRGNDSKGYGSMISADSAKPQAGAAGDIFIQARNVKLAEGAQISSLTWGTGQGGTVQLQVAETLQATGTSPDGSNSTLISSTSENEELENAGNAGNVIIQARKINVADGARISSTTWGTGQSGTVHLQVAETLTVTGVDVEGYPSGVSASSQNEKLADAGAAGNLQIEARQVVLTNGGRLTSGTWGTGPGGSISLQVSGTLTVSGPQAVSGKQSHVIANSIGTMENAGQAGQIGIQANTINILKDGEISTQSENADGGNLTILSPNLLYLQQGQITTSVKGGIGNGGNITIGNPQFVVMNHGRIVAQADAGHGGNIHIVAQQFLNTPNSLISASSRVGLDGQVRIDSPDQTIGDSLLASPKEFTDVTGLLPRRCDQMSFEEFLNRSTFYVYPIAGEPLSPYDLKPSHAFRLVSTLPTVSLARVSQERRAIDGQRLAWLTGCHS
jgi:filamentous hemagglutinin family protein